MNEPVQHWESRVSSESRRALFSAMLFLLLFHCSNTQMDSPLLLEYSVSLSVSLSVCLSVTQLSWQGRQVHPCTLRYLLGFLMGIFKVILHAVKWLNFSLSLSRVFFHQLLQMHSGPEVIGNSMTACRRNNMFAYLGLWLFSGRWFEPLSSTVCLLFSRVAPYLSRSLLFFPCVLPLPVQCDGR